MLSSIKFLGCVTENLIEKLKRSPVRRLQGIYVTFRQLLHPGPSSMAFVLRPLKFFEHQDHLITLVCSFHQYFNNIFLFVFDLIKYLPVNCVQFT